MGFHLRMSADEARALLAACERAAGNEQAVQDHERAAAAARARRPAEARQSAATDDAGSFVLVPPDAGPLIRDGVEYTGREPPNPWLDGDRVRREEPGWRIAGRQRVPR